MTYHWSRFTLLMVMLVMVTGCHHDVGTPVAEMEYQNQKLRADLSVHKNISAGTIERLKKEIKVKDATIKQLKDKLDSSKNSNEKAPISPKTKKLEKDYNELLKKLKVCNSKNRVLEEMLKSRNEHFQKMYERLEKEKATLNTTLNAKKDELKKLDKNIASLEKKLTDQQEISKKARQQLREKIEKFAQKELRVMREKAAIEKADAASKIDDLKNEKAELNKKLQDALKSPIVSSEIKHYLNSPKKMFTMGYYPNKQKETLAICKALQIKVIKAYGANNGNYLLCQWNDNLTQDILNLLKLFRGTIRDVRPIGTGGISGATSSLPPFYTLLTDEKWAIKNIDASLAWNTLDRNQSELEPITVAMIDMGFDIYHKDLEKHLWTDSQDSTSPGAAHFISQSLGAQALTATGGPFAAATQTLIASMVAEMDAFPVNMMHGRYFYFGKKYSNIRPYPKTDEEKDKRSVIQRVHGTHCAGLIVATATKQVRLPGRSIQLMCIKMYAIPEKKGSSKDMFYTSDLIAAIDYAIDNKAKIISLSLGGKLPSKDKRSYWTDVAKAIKRAVENDILVVCSAGNDPNYQPNDLSGTAVQLDVVSTLVGSNGYLNFAPLFRYSHFKTGLERRNINSKENFTALGSFFRFADIEEISAALRPTTVRGRNIVDNIIVVGSVTPNRTISTFSNFGDKIVDIAAPGGTGHLRRTDDLSLLDPRQDVLSTIPADKRVIDRSRWRNQRGVYDAPYAALYGTSQAAPIVAGAAALLWSHPKYRTLKAYQIKDLLRANAVRTDKLEGKIVKEGGSLNLAFIRNHFEQRPVARNDPRFEFDGKLRARHFNMAKDAYFRGYNKFWSGKCSEAVDLLKGATIYFHDPLFYYYLAFSHASLGKHEQATKDLKIAFSLHENIPAEQYRAALERLQGSNRQLIEKLRWLYETGDPFPPSQEVWKDWKDPCKYPHLPPDLPNRPYCRSCLSRMPSNYLPR